MAAAEMAVALHVTDDRLDGGAAAEFTFDRAEDTALLPGDEDATRALRRVAAISLVDIGALDGASGQRSEEHTSELQSRLHLVCRLLLEKKKLVNQDGFLALFTS